MPVRVVDRACHGRQQSCDREGIPHQAGDVLREAAAIDPLHGEVEAAPAVDLVDRHDVRVVEVGRRLGLQEESLLLRLRGERAGLDHLQGDEAVEAPLVGLVDDAHPAPRDLLEKFEVAEVLAEAGPSGWRGPRPAAGCDRRVLPFGVDCLRVMSLGLVAPVSTSSPRGGWKAAVIAVP